MARNLSKASWSRLFSDYGMLLVLLLLGAFFAAVTLEEQQPTGVAGARTLAGEITGEFQPGTRVLIVVRDMREESEFARELATRLGRAGLAVVETVQGQPADARQALARLVERGEQLAVIAGTQATANWSVLEQAPSNFPALGPVKLAWPRS